MPARPPLMMLVIALTVSCAPPQVRGLLTASVSASIRVSVPRPPPPPPPPAVALDSVEVVEFFGVPLDGAQDVVFVLDVSGSMSSAAAGRIARLQAHKKESPEAALADATETPSNGAPPASVTTAPSKIEVARAELMSAIERLPAETRLNVIFFSDRLEAYSGQVVSMSEAERPGLLAFVASANANGGTALAPAMRTAFVLGARRVVLLSDGHGNVGGDDYDVLRDAREAMHGGVRIDTIGIGPGHDAQLLRMLSVESGGLYQPL